MTEEKQYYIFCSDCIEVVKDYGNHIGHKIAIKENHKVKLNEITKEEQEKTKCDFQKELKFVKLGDGGWLASDNDVFGEGEVLTDDALDHVYANLPWADSIDYITVTMKIKK